MYKHETKNSNPELVDYDCPVCNQAKPFIITNFRLDLCEGDKICILGNDLLVDRICLECLNNAVNSWRV